MSLKSSLSDNRQHQVEMYTPKKLLQYEFDDDRTHLLSRLHQLNIETDSIKRDNQNSKSSDINYNNSYVPIEIKDNLSALYAHYQIDSRMYPPPDLQLYKTIQSSFHPSHSYLQLLRLQNSNLSEQQRKSSNNSTRRSPGWRKKQKRLRSNKTREKNNNKRPETNYFHYHNMITVRRISCHDMFHSQTRMKKQFKYKQNNLKNKKIKNEWNKKIKSTNLIENKSLVSPSTPKLNMKTLTTPTSNSLFQQQEIRKEISNSMSMTGLKVNSFRDSSTSSLVSTQLLADAYNQTKRNVIITTTTPPGSSKIAMSNVAKLQTVVAPTSTEENIQDIVDQLKNRIATLNLSLQNKTEHEKNIISNIKSYSDEKRSRTKKKSSSSSLSLTSTPDRLIFSKKSMSDEKNLVFENITVRRCNSSNNQGRKKYQDNIPTLYNDQPEELKRCLLIYCRDRTNKNRHRNINSNERQRNSHRTWYDWASNEHLLLSQSSRLIRHNSIDVISASKSTLILAEEDDEYELLDKLSRVSSL